MHMTQNSICLKREKNSRFPIRKRTTAEASTLSTAVCGIISGNLQDDVEPVGVETNLRYAGRDEEIEGDYDTILAEHLKKEF